jgi:hypothetical protein
METFTPGKAKLGLIGLRIPGKPDETEAFEESSFVGNPLWMPVKSACRRRFTQHDQIGPTLMAETAKPVQLKPATLQAFDVYIRDAEAGMERTLGGTSPFLWSDADPGRARQVRQRQIVAQFWSGKEPVKVPHGLIHDWIGAAFTPGRTVIETLALVQDYSNHKNIYKPEVIDSRLVSHRNNDFQIYLRLLKKKIITVVLDTDHDVHYSSLGATRWCLRSYTTRIAEVEDAGKPNEKVLPPDAGYGFLWRLDSYWRFQERDGGVYVECRAISLTRDVPKGLGWIIEPIVRKLPRESLMHTLKATRDALSSGVAQAALPA